ncbi:hypothetical protein NESM_000426100 [Novymonas esmeraldas]|uniref:Uncharacterized protein n=1 Tax=Novymonas esmeraldas TaxID=1808958 RepID=A0AAW0EQE9_9TRYP
MSAPVLSIGIAPQERVRLCSVAATDVCRRAVAYVDAATECEAHDADSVPYVRAVYVHRAGAVTAVRVAVASGSECGSYLRETLQAVAAGLDRPTVACWLTVTLEDTCIVQHAVFAASPDSPDPLNLTSPVTLCIGGAAHQPGRLRWSLTPARATADGNVHTPRETALAAATPPPVSPPAPAPASVHSVYERIEKYQTGAAGSSRRSSRATAAAEPAPPSPPHSRVGGGPRSGGPASNATTPSHPHSPGAHPSRGIDRNAATTPSESGSAAAPPRSGDRRPPNGLAVDRPVRRASDASSTAASPHSEQDHRRPRPNANELLVFDSPRADLVAPSDGRQCNDWAFRTGYAPRREELWEIADAVMTHNYHHELIEPPRDDDDAC